MRLLLKSDDSKDAVWLEWGRGKINALKRILPIAFKRYFTPDPDVLVELSYDPAVPSAAFVKVIRKALGWKRVETFALSPDGTDVHIEQVVSVPAGVVISAFSRDGAMVFLTIIRRDENGKLRLKRDENGDPIYERIQLSQVYTGQYGVFSASYLTAWASDDLARIAVGSMASYEVGAYGQGSSFVSYGFYRNYALSNGTWSQTWERSATIDGNGYYFIQFSAEGVGYIHEDAGGTRTVDLYVVDSGAWKHTGVSRSVGNPSGTNYLVGSVTGRYAQISWLSRMSDGFLSRTTQCFHVLPGGTTMFVDDLRFPPYIYQDTRLEPSYPSRRRAGEPYLFTVRKSNGHGEGVDGGFEGEVYRVAADGSLALVGSEPTWNWSTSVNDTVDVSANGKTAVVRMAEVGNNIVSVLYSITFGALTRTVLPSSSQTLSALAPDGSVYATAVGTGTDGDGVFRIYTNTPSGFELALERSIPNVYAVYAYANYVAEDGSGGRYSAADGTWQPVPSEAFGPLTDDGNYFVTPTATIHFVVEENGAKKWVVRTLPQTDEIVRADYAEDTGEMRLAFIDRHEVWKLRDKVDGVFVWEWYKVSDVPATYYLAPTVPQGLVPVYHGLPSELVPAYAVLSFGAKELVSSRGVQKLEPFESQVDWRGYSFLTDQRHPRDTGMAAPKNLIMGPSSRYVAGATEAYILEPAQ